MLVRADRARAEVRAADDQPEEILLRVAFGAELVLAPQLRRLTDDASLGVITLTSSTSDALLAVREEIADAAIVWDGHGDREGLRTVVLRDIAVHLALPATHRLAKSTSVPVADLAEETILMFPKALSPKVWDTMHHHLLPDGRADLSRSSPNLTTPDPYRSCVASRRQGRSARLAPVAEHTRPEGVVLRPLDPPLTLPLELAWREPANGALQRVVAFLQSECLRGSTLDG